MNPMYIVILLYFIIIFFIAWFFSRKESLKEYYLNNKSSSLWLLTFSHVASIIGAGAVISTMAAIYDSGISYGITAMLSFVFGALLLAFLAPKIVAIGNTYGIYSVVDFFKVRFDKKNQTLVLILQFVLLIVRTTAQIMGISYLVSVLAGVNHYVALCIAVGLTLLYTARGGLKIDLIVDFFQFWVIVAVFVIMAVLGYQHVGGFTALFAHLPSGHLHPFAFGGAGFLVGSMIFGGLIYLSNTTHRQRILSAKNEHVAKKSFYLSLPFLIILLLIIVFLGLVSSVLLPGMDKNMIVFSLMNKILPNTWLIGLGFSCILAVIMSSLDILLTSGSTITYRLLFATKNITEKKSLLLARGMTMCFGLVCLVVALFVPDIITLTLLSSYLALLFVPAIFAGLFSKKISSNASFYSILLSTIVLLIGFFTLGKNIFIVSTVLAILVIVFYDRIFKNHTLLSSDSYKKSD